MPVEFDPFSGPEILRILPAIEPQLEIYISCRLGGEDANRSYNESVSLLLTGAFDREAMDRALQDIIARHEALRSAFSPDGRKIIVFRQLPVNLYFEDLSTRSKYEQQAFIDNFSQQEACKAFDLLNGPLFRMALFRLGNEEHFFKLTAHHIICDGWSLGILLQDLGKLYSAYAKGLLPNLPEATRFSQYALEQWESLESPEYIGTVQYWLDQYKGSIPVLDMPTDFPRPTLRTYKSQRDDYPLEGSLVQSIKKLGAGAGCSIVMTLMAAFEVFLHRLTGQEDIILGLPAAGQSNSGYQNLVGHCVHLLPLRSQPKGDISFLAYLRQRKPKIFDAYDHQQFTFGSLLKRLPIARDPSRIPLVPVVFNIDMGLDNGVAFHNLHYRMTYNPREYESFEIFLNASGSEQALTLEWSYNTQLFKPSSISRMMDGFEHLLRQLTTQPDALIRDLPVMDSYARNHRLDTLNDTSVDYPKDKTLYALIDQQAAATPDHPALLFEGISISYKTLAEKSSRLAHYLQSCGVHKGDAVGLALDRSAEMIIALIAIWKAGAAYIPLDPAYPDERIEFMLKDAAAGILLTTSKYRTRFHSQAKSLTLEDCWDKIAHNPATPPVTGTGADLAYILYTSGSTGTPKGVEIEHHNLVNFLLSMQREPGITGADRLLAVTTISFDIAGLELYLPLISGATLVLADAESAKDGRILLDMVRMEKITMMQATPSTWRMMLDAGWNNHLPLKALCGGEGLPKDLAETLVTKCSSLWNMYGPTETTIWSTLKQIQPGDDTITIGRPINNTRVYMLDESAKPVALGAIGEIYIGGDGVARGYHNRPALTAERFLSDPFAKDGSKMYRTGDLGRLLETGDILCLGRIDHQVKIRGHRIELGEIEHSLVKQPGIKEAVVIAREDRPGDQRLVAYIVPTGNSLPEGSHFPLNEQREWEKGLHNLLPAYMIPNDFIAMQQLPLTANGKIDRKALPRPVAKTGALPKEYTPPATELEKIIAASWIQSLGLSKVSVHDDFFELGGHSMIAIQVMTQLEKTLDKRLPLTTLVECPTIAQLAGRLEQKDKDLSWSSLVAIRAEGSKTPLYIVHGGGLTVLIFHALAMSMDPDQPVYGLQAKGLNGIDEPLDNMDAIAAHYVAEILEHNPDGPFCLAGYSFGGFIAFEMARQLQAMGKEVKMLGIFDTAADNTSVQFDPLWKRMLRKFGRQFPKLLFILQSLGRHPGQTIKYQSSFFRRKMRVPLEKVGLLHHMPNELNTLENAGKVNEKIEIAYRDYKMEPLNILVDLFKVKTRLYFVSDPDCLSWRPYALKGVAVHEVPGDHKTFLMDPHYREMAGILQRCLDQRTAAPRKEQKDPVTLRPIITSRGKLTGS
ncbi:non-ribosomal peptide synthetase [Puia dinghuensis]|uniref:non-ribosomal peptide synthetase n=1 Tax=Puia dinghuensis TaxID=1792502 RepID=UPI001E2DAF9B|nr:non-ribosomal peptide synthetase [Puia dinghuensis]